ncbi:MAG: S41 family peptidase, partial [Parcubacteria group bacterium]|nr:S41 family peptidase [Parcubacteria group bacterium]
MSFLKKYRAILISAIIIAAAFVGGFYLGKSEREIVVVNSKGEPAESGEVTIRPSQVKEYLGRDVDFDLFTQVWGLLKKQYVDQPVSETKLFYGALQGMVASLDDPYSVFLEPQISEEFTESLNGRFEGIGAEIALKREQLTVVAPLDGSPAEAAGLKARDVITDIDGESTQDLTLDEAVNRIRGEKGTTVVLTVAREGEDAPLDIHIIRDTISVKSVSWEMQEGSIAYVYLRNFNADTARAFKAIQREVVSESPAAIIFDLRNNPGGFLQTSVDVASAWVPEGGTVVIERSVDGSTTYTATGSPLFAGIPTVVLVNAGSASASEIVAGALQDHGLGRVIGEQTFGKGSVQVLEDLPDGSSVKFTVAKWFTPKNRSINEEGITPDEVIELSEEDFGEDRDPQMDRALEYLR